MCQSQAEGGRRCYAHQRQRVDKLEQRLAESSPDTAEHEEITSRLEAARADLIQTRTGLQEHITERTAAGGSYDAEQLTANINRYVADSPTGKPLTLPGGSFRVVRAHTSHGRTVLEVTGPTSARSYSSGLAERYTQDAAGKQVTRATPTELQRDFHTMLVLADGRAGAAVRHSGEISAVYSDGSSRGATRALLPIAAERGGTHLECFDTFLPKIYARSGFVKVASIPFNREFAPDGWDYSAMSRVAPPRGEPDITFMVTQDQYEKFGRPEPRSFQDYDEADEYTRTGHTS